MTVGVYIYYNSESGWKGWDTEEYHWPFMQSSRAQLLDAHGTLLLIKTTHNFVDSDLIIVT